MKSNKNIEWDATKYAYTRPDVIILMIAVCIMALFTGNAIDIVYSCSTDTVNEKYLAELENPVTVEEYCNTFWAAVANLVLFVIILIITQKKFQMYKKEFKQKSEFK